MLLQMSTTTRHNLVSMSQKLTGHHPTVSRLGFISANNVRVAMYLFQAATDLDHLSWTDKSYNFPFSKWASWCAEQDRNPISGPISNVANFLAELYEKSYQCSSLNAYCFAIS